ncbi:DMT family transporter [Pseudolabrys taiwanensis]|uniref:DMT family transporter n=1 Tax=Pseudolabrys taiwanensis TaxID=331696 RepID=A0A346A113_9HYPH|nr:DMT family transporter [Pseudolabrys taiwanensis]AXK82860.1 DMT family transporter [Pseudolabrys taiwanensis]
MRNNPFLLLALAGLCWSGNHLVGRAMAGEVPPIGASTLRWLVPLALVLPLARPHLARDWPEIRKHWPALLWLGMTGGAMFSILQFVGLRYTTALNVSVLNSLVPVLIIAVGTLMFRDRITGFQIAGIITSSLGVLVVISRGQFDTLRQFAFNWGDLLTVLSMLFFSVYAACLRLRPRINGWSFLVVLAAISVVVTLPLAIAEAYTGTTFKATWLTFGSLAYVSIFPSVVAYAAWNRGVELIGANRAGPFLHLVPIYTAILATTLLGEPLALFHIVGFGLILSGVWLASVRKPV